MNDHGQKPGVKKGKLSNAQGASKFISHLGQECLKLALGSNERINSFVHSTTIEYLQMKETQCCLI